MWTGQTDAGPGGSSDRQLLCAGPVQRLRCVPVPGETSGSAVVPGTCAGTWKQQPQWQEQPALLGKGVGAAGLGRGTTAAGTAPRVGDTWGKS